MTGKTQTGLFFACWLAVMGAMSFTIESHLFTGKFGTQSKDPLYLLLGSVKEVIGDTFFLKASSYFHGGVDTNLIQHEDSLGDEAHGGEERAHETFKKVYTDWVYKINSRVKVLEHRHLEGEEVKEILPLFKMSVALDPYNVSAILTTAYWLKANFGKTSDATEILKQGVKDNPDDWEISYRLGLSYFKDEKKFSESAVYLEKAVKKMNSENSGVTDRRAAYYYLAESYFDQGLRAPALEAYKKALTYFGETVNLSVRSRIIDRIKRLS